MAIKTTKNLLLCLIVLLTVLLFIQACKKSNNGNKNENENLNLTGTHILKKDVVKNVTEDNQKVELTAIGFDITSCPPNVTCISGGYAIVKIKFKDETKEQTLQLCVGGCTISSVPPQDIVTINGIKYNVKLTDVASAEKITEVPKAQITVARVGP